MSGLQKEAIQMINGLSEQKMQAFQEMEIMKANLSSYFPADFNPEQEYEEAISEKYGSRGSQSN